MRNLLLIASILLTSVAYSHDGIFIRGDANDDDNVNLSDMIYVANYLFSSGPAPANLDAADANDDGAVNISDYGYLNNYLFNSGSAPLAPFPDEGIDLTPDGIQNSTSPAIGSSVEQSLFPNQGWADEAEHTDLPWDTQTALGVDNGIAFFTTENTNDCFGSTSYDAANYFIDTAPDPNAPPAIAWANGLIGIKFTVKLQVDDYDASGVCHQGYNCGWTGENLIVTEILNLIASAQTNTGRTAALAVDPATVSSSGPTQAISYNMNPHPNCSIKITFSPSSPKTYYVDIHAPWEFNGSGALGQATADIALLSVGWDHIWDQGETFDYASREYLKSRITVTDIIRYWGAP